MQAKKKKRTVFSDQHCYKPRTVFKNQPACLFTQLNTNPGYSRMQLVNDYFLWRGSVTKAHRKCMEKLTHRGGSRAARLPGAPGSNA